MQSAIWRRNLKALRKLKSISQEGLAEKLNKSQQAIGNWEKGSGEPNIAELKTITKLFGISIDEFLNTDVSANNILKDQIASSADITPNEAPAPNLDIYLELILAQKENIKLLNELLAMKGKGK